MTRTVENAVSDRGSGSPTGSNASETKHQGTPPARAHQSSPRRLLDHHARYRAANPAIARIRPPAEMGQTPPRHHPNCLCEPIIRGNYPSILSRMVPRRGLPSELQNRTIQQSLAPSRSMMRMPRSRYQVVLPSRYGTMLFRWSRMIRTWGNSFKSTKRS